MAAPRSLYTENIPQNHIQYKP